jgi:hypothetical protein
MKKHLAIAAAAALISVGIAAPTQAHHAVNAQFDVAQEIAVTGILTKMDPVNPHSWWHFKVTNAAGVAEDWSFESGSPAALRRAGLSVKEDVKAGNTYQLVYNPSRNGSKTGFMRAITANGKRVAMSGNG